MCRRDFRASLMRSWLVEICDFSASFVLSLFSSCIVKTLCCCFGFVGLSGLSEAVGSLCSLSCVSLQLSKKLQLPFVVQQ